MPLYTGNCKTIQQPSRSRAEKGKRKHQIYDKRNHDIFEGIMICLKFEEAFPIPSSHPYEEHPVRLESDMSVLAFPYMIVESIHDVPDPGCLHRANQQRRRDLLSRGPGRYRQRDLYYWGRIRICSYEVKLFCLEI